MITGNPVDGFTYLGPFATNDEVRQAELHTLEICSQYETIKERVIQMDAIKSILTMEEITDALENTRTKGEYETAVKNFLSSGEVYCDMTALFPSKEEANLKNNIKKYAKESGVPFQLAMYANGNEDGKAHVLLVNLDAYRLAQQQENES